MIEFTIKLTDADAVISFVVIMFIVALYKLAISKINKHSK